MNPTHTTEMTILVADDEQGMRELLTVWLEPEYEVRVACDGKEALALTDDDVDLALLDRRMPGMSGDEVLDALREENYDFPVAMITAVTPDLDVVDMPFDDYIVKPVGKDELLRTVELMQKRAEYDRESRRFFRLASKQAKLRASENVDHHMSDEYDRIGDEMEQLHSHLDSVLGELAAQDLQVAFQQV